MQSTYSSSRSTDRFAVFGLSLGGPYAVAIAALLGHRVNGCGVIAGVTDMAWVPAREDYDETEVALMRTGSEDEAIEWCQHEVRNVRAEIGGGSAERAQRGEEDRRLVQPNDQRR